ncbi:MAG TPA: GntG family PLP-dependent aldolase [Bryobacteraceae bacterium]|nr:GntG family PLP-dependent aldolase [Bryobacteraceae bacterium]
MSEIIDLRSDTVTHPTPAMRHAMFDAEVGDDVYGEDPTVNRLESRAAEIAGKEAALFVPTGTMGNTIAIKLLTTHGQEVICDSRGHLLNYELSMAAWFAGCLIRPVDTSDGILTWDKIRPQVRPLGPHSAPTGCIELEDTHNMAGGTIYPVDVIGEICDEAHKRGIGVHLDGARVFNAAVAQRIEVVRICERVDTVMFCLSKGLAAPAGSMLAGSRELIDRGRLYRKRLGGGMRQSGILAAAGLVALDTMVDRLAEDHANARRLATFLATLTGVRVQNPDPATNIVVFDVARTGRTAQAISADLKRAGVLINPISATSMRLVTHCDFDAASLPVVQAALSAAIAA